MLALACFPEALQRSSMTTDPIYLAQPHHAKFYLLEYNVPLVVCFVYLLVLVEVTTQTHN